MSKTLKLVYPQWQGGNFKNYAFGADLLSWIIPNVESIKEVTVEVERDFDSPQLVEDGVVSVTAISKQIESARKILAEERPDKLIIVGGDCAVDQEPFDYLHGKYGDKLGIIWLDAHPDVSSPEFMQNDHAMVLGNLLGEGAPALAAKVQHPLSSDQVIFAGLQELLPNEEEFVTRRELARISPEDLFENSDKLTDWIKENGFEYVAIHFDLDVLDPEDFRLILPAQPHLKDFPATVGALSLDQVGRIFKDVAEVTEIVGLGIAEFMPWDVINLQNVLKDISIFK